ncbi:uncharacterized protein RSE6_09463 [Rhynchosporium secalis]|uniref:FAD-binding domain-containing protein n=1 Tax=Rhynchosporium secalis TaxID=38038 RepID=A0A1E1MHY5_RHYSE|nr:uncharacterized protein RSE6_09463 [Rhynchosporium secalis]
MNSPSREEFKVIVVGGGIAGLALACALERAGIDYLVPGNGMRLLDQLGIVDQVREGAVMHENDTIWTGGNGSEKGKKAAPARMMRAPLGGDIEYGRSRHGYEVEGVKGMEHGEKEVVVRCENGEVYHGDVLHGADGTHSFVRTEMRKLIEKKDPKLLDKDKKILQPHISTEHVDFVVGGTDGKVTLSDLWKRKKVGGLQGMDGGHHEHWTFGRIACFGDFVHKVTANAGTGGNMCIEGAAAVTNMDIFSDGMVGGPKFDFLPTPRISLGVGMPWNRCYGVTKHESLWRRAPRALPLLGVFYVSRSVLIYELPNKLSSLLVQCFKGGVIANGLSSTLLRTVFTGREALDTFMMPFLAAFTPGLAFKNHGEGDLDVYAPQRMQALSFLTDYFAFNANWMIESCRRGNIWTFARIPVVFLLAAQLYGIGVVAPIYFFLHYVQIPSTEFHAADNRHVPIHPVKTILPTLLLGYVATTIVMYYFTSSISTLQAWNHIWQPFPIYIAILHGILSSLLPDT